MQDAEKALKAFNGHKVGTRNIRCNWATQRSTLENNEQQNQDQAFSYNPGILNHYYPPFMVKSTVYVGNLAQNTTGFFQLIKFSNWIIYFIILE
jgi:hypothetical protein